MSINALVLNSSDTVATTVKPLDSGDIIDIAAENIEISVTLRESIPLGHKFALKDIEQGERIIKYGETIGLATMVIYKGEHVHVHNVEGLRGRGDRP
jgi:altronate dehydratase small subunit